MSGTAGERKTAKTQMITISQQRADTVGAGKAHRIKEEMRVDREKELEEIAQAQGNYCKSNNRSCKDCMIKNDEECRNYIIAQILYEKGIRVADEVRKETAKEIAEWLKSQDYGFAAEIILKKYGVEVDE